jgi:hypothetical protein
MTNADHAPRYDRRPLGRSIPWNRPTYGYTVRCSCGWTTDVNGTKRDAEWTWRDHRNTAREGKE